MMTFSRWIISFVVSVVLISLGAWWRHPGHCSDCFERHGFPFDYQNDGGFAGGGWFHPWGLAADVAIWMILACVIYFVWRRLARR
jgi:hypothetical protein